MIELRRADGTAMPYRLNLEPVGACSVRTRVVGASDEATIAEAVFNYHEIPLTDQHGDVEANDICLGYEPDSKLLLIEFGGEDARLAMLPAAEVRSALSVCRWYDQAMVA